MTNRDGLMTVEILYHHLDRIGVMPEVDQVFPCDEAPSGSLLVVEKTPIIRGGRRLGWTIRGRDRQGAITGVHGHPHRAGGPVRIDPPEVDLPALEHRLACCGEKERVDGRGLG